MVSTSSEAVLPMVNTCSDRAIKGSEGLSIVSAR